MKKIKQSISTVLPTTKIFFDDLQEIDKILKESCSSYNIIFNENEDEDEDEDKIIKKLEKIKRGESESYYIITLDEYELSSIDEIKEIKEKQDFHNLKITLTEPFFCLAMDEFDTCIYSYEDSLCIGITARIKPILEKRRKINFELWSFFKDDKSKFIVFTTKKSNEQNNYFIENKDELITKLLFGIITTSIGIFIGNKVIPWFTSLLTNQ